MKITIDTDKRAITVESNVNMGELVDWMEANLKTWEDWTLRPTTVQSLTPSPLNDLPCCGVSKTTINPVTYLGDGVQK